jgi:hypothetical protein
VDLEAQPSEPQPEDEAVPAWTEPAEDAGAIEEPELAPPLPPPEPISERVDTAVRWPETEPEAPPEASVEIGDAGDGDPGWADPEAHEEPERKKWWRLFRRGEEA